MAEKLAYIRVSTKAQNEQRQVEKMRELGIPDEKMYIDKSTGKNFERPAYQKLKDYVRPNDEIYIDSIDRLGRDYDGIINEWKSLTREKKAEVITLDNDLFNSKRFKQMDEDMAKMMEDQMLAIFSYIAALERQKMLDRQADGIRIARENGVKFGKKAFTLDSLDNHQKQTLKENYERWKTKKITGVYFMKLLNLKKNTFYKIIKLYEESKKEKE